MLPISSGIDVAAPALTSGAFVPARIPAGNTALNPAVFSKDLVTPYVQGVKAGQEISQPIADAMEYMSPENRALRAAKIALATTEAASAPSRMAAEIAANTALAKNAGALSAAQLSGAQNAAALSGLNLTKAQTLSPLEIKTEQAMLNNQGAMAESMNKFYQGGGLDKELQNKFTVLDNQGKEIANKTKQLDLEQTKFENDKTLQPQELQLKRDTIEKDREALKLQQDQIDVQKNVFQKMQQAQPKNTGTQTPSSTTSNLAPTDEERAQALSMKVMTDMRNNKVDSDDMANLDHYNKTGILPLSKEQITHREAKLKSLNDDDVVKQAQMVIPAYNNLVHEIMKKNGSGAQAAFDKFYQITNKSGVKINSGSVELIENSRPLFNKYIGKLNSAFTGNPLLDTDIKNFMDVAKTAADDYVTHAVNGPIKDAKADLEQNGVPNRTKLIPTLEDYAAQLQGGAPQNPLKPNESRTLSSGAVLTRVK